MFENEDNDEDFTTFEVAYEAFLFTNISVLEEWVGVNGFPHGTDPWLGIHWLTHAISLCNPTAVEWVLSKEVDVHYVDGGGFTALKSALQAEGDCQIRATNKHSPSEASARTIQTINLLIEAGIDVNQRMSLNYTALHAAAAWSSVDVVRHLLDLGANPGSLSTDYGASRPVDDAKFLKRWEIHEMMCEVMGLTPSGRPY